MREIKFRGKRLDNGEWVYGNLLKCEHKDSDSVYIIPFVTNGSFTINTLMLNFISPCYAVDPATVGQYTSLKDCNGKEIYEGDIVEAKDPYKYNSKEIFYTCEVVFTEGAAFMLKHTYENWGTVGIRYFGLRDMELEVIGNIYENPELLEGDGEE